MSGELGKQLEKLAANFNASQSEYRIVPTYKGNYTETVTAAIFAFRSRSQPAIVQVNEIATATMMAAKGAIYPVFELMRDSAFLTDFRDLSARATRGCVVLERPDRIDRHVGRLQDVEELVEPERALRVAAVGIEQHDLAAGLAAGAV